MTEPERKKWRVERWRVYEEGTERELGVFDSETDAARIVALHNVSGEPIGWQWKPSDDPEAHPGISGGGWRDQLVTEKLARMRASDWGGEARPLYAAPPAPDPPAEVEWRVSDFTLSARLRRRASNETDPDGRVDLDLRDARAALARRPAPKLATPVIDETIAELLQAVDIQETGDPEYDVAVRNSAKTWLRDYTCSILAEHDAVAAGRPGRWWDGWIAGRGAAATRARRFQDMVGFQPSESRNKLIGDIEKAIRSLAPPAENEEDRE